NLFLYDAQTGEVRLVSHTFGADDIRVVDNGTVFFGTSPSFPGGGWGLFSFQPGSVPGLNTSDTGGVQMTIGVAPASTPQTLSIDGGDGSGVQNIDVAAFAASAFGAHAYAPGDWTATLTLTSAPDDSASVTSHIAVAAPAGRLALVSTGFAHTFLAGSP